MGLSSKVLLARLERSGSLSKIIWIFFCILTVVIMSIIFSDTLFPKKGFETQYGTHEPKNQSIYLTR